MKLAGLIIGGEGAKPALARRARKSAWKGEVTGARGISKALASVSGERMGFMKEETFGAAAASMIAAAAVAAPTGRGAVILSPDLRVAVPP